MKGKLIPLNIVMTYPVRWGKYKVLRDFIQNFYDSVGFADWQERFNYSYEDGTLTMWVEGVEFSYEWLTHIGASTKTNDASLHAGYFGEGFKIASLCAVRDCGWQVFMSSGEWELQVIRQKSTIDNKEVEMLAYDLWDAPDKGRSTLKLFPLTQQDFWLFQQAIVSFYYYGNPLLGEKLWEGQAGAVYLFSGKGYTDVLPCTHEFKRQGAVFCGYQLLGSNPFGLAVCLHAYKKEDRERSELYAFDVVDVLSEIAYYISPLGAMRMLEKMKRNWNSLPKKRNDIHSWSPVVTMLLKKISEDSDVRNAFREKYPYLLCLRAIHTVQEENRRKQARTWMSLQDTPYRLVQRSFALLGYPTLEEVCEENGGFVMNDRPTEQEGRCFDVLEGVIRELYQGFFDISQGLPERHIIMNILASYHGMARVYRKKQRGVHNYTGLFLRYDVCEIYLKRTIFTKDGYFDALATYIHEMCHAFGTDSSQSFSLGLTRAMEILLTGHETIMRYKLLWEKEFENATPTQKEDSDP